MTPMTRDEAQRIIESAIKMSKAEGVSVNVSANVTGNTRSVGLRGRKFLRS
jgi:hypothetical protein